MWIQEGVGVQASASHRNKKHRPQDELLQDEVQRDKGLAGACWSFDVQAPPRIDQHQPLVELLCLMRRQLVEAQDRGLVRLRESREVD